MDEDEQWLSEEENEDEEDLSDPGSFTMALTSQGPPGGTTCNLHVYQ